MRFVILGRLGHVGLARPTERAEAAYKKANEMGITSVQRFMTSGHYDYCTIIDCPTVAIAVAFGQWYRREGFGDVELLLIHEDEEVQEITALLEAQ